MNKIYLLVCLFCGIFTFSLSAQNFSDDFESYTVGDYLGSNSSDWTTWSGDTGTAEDVKVTDAQSASGNNGIYFSSTSSGGGPQDVVLPFGQKYTSGIFTFSCNVYVEAGTGAYWNFQGETAIGSVWAHNCYFLDTGELQFSDGDNGLALSTTYTADQWVNIVYEINLDLNAWKISVDGDCLGTFSNSVNAVASLDVFPLQGNSFYMDDIAFSHTTSPLSVLAYDASIDIDDLGVGGLTGMTQDISGTITNYGAETMTSADIAMSTPNGVETITLDNLNLTTGESTTFTAAQPYILAEGAQSLTFDVVSINGTEADEDACNSRSSSQLLGVTPAEGKNIVVEEGTGTWCGWCPRGSVFLERLTEKYGDRFIGVAVHNGDPMVVNGYDGGHGFTGYPAATVMRRSADSGFGTQGDLELPFLQYISQAPKATFEVTATYDEASETMMITPTVTANQDLSDVNLMMVITEDHVTGTAPGYAQANYYSGADIDMGGYQDLTDPVPASNMIYDHVARAIPLGFAGDSDSFAEMLPSGESRSFTYEYTLGTGHNFNNTHIVMILINSDGTMDNAYTISANDAAGVTSTEELLIANDIKVFPNPTSDVLNINMNIVEALPLTIEIVDVVGKTYRNEKIQTTLGLNTYTLNTNDLAAGMYYAVLRNGGASKVVKFVKQ